MDANYILSCNNFKIFCSTLIEAEKIDNFCIRSKIISTSLDMMYWEWWLFSACCSALLHFYFKVILLCSLLICIFNLIELYALLNRENWKFCFSSSSSGFDEISNKVNFICRCCCHWIGIFLVHFLRLFGSVLSCNYRICKQNFSVLMKIERGARWGRNI